MKLKTTLPCCQAKSLHKFTKEYFSKRHAEHQI